MGVACTPTIALVIAEKQKNSNGFNAKTTWQNCLANIQQNTSPPEEIEMIHDNIWLIPLR
jgi:hypothetical protein